MEIAIQRTTKHGIPLNEQHRNLLKSIRGPASCEDEANMFEAISEEIKEITQARCIKASLTKG